MPETTWLIYQNPILDGQISWVHMTSEDGSKTGNDVDGIWYIKDAMDTYFQKWPSASNRVGIFWAGGATTQEDMDNVKEFATVNLKGNAHMAKDVFTGEDLRRIGLDAWTYSNPDHLWWRAINRACKGMSPLKSSNKSHADSMIALAATCSGASDGKAYVYLKNTNCRTLFSPSSHKPQDCMSQTLFFISYFASESHFF